MYGLRLKEQTDYNGIESYISELIRQEDISWFPILRAQSLANDEQKQKDKDKKLMDKVDRIIQELKTMNELLDKTK